MANLDELFICELNTFQTWGLEQLDLWLNQEIEGNLRNKERGTGSCGVTNGSANILDAQIFAGIDRVQSSTKDVVEDVVDPSASAQFLCRNISRRTVNGCDKVAGKLCQQLQDQGTL